MRLKRTLCWNANRQREGNTGVQRCPAANSESHVPCFQERVDTGTHILSGCRGVSGLVPQPLCMKFKSACADWNESFVSRHPRVCNKSIHRVRPAVYFSAFFLAAAAFVVLLTNCFPSREAATFFLSVAFFSAAVSSFHALSGR